MSDYRGLIRVGIQGLGEIRQLNNALRTTAELVSNLENAQVNAGQIAQGAQRNVDRAAQRRRIAGLELSRAQQVVASTAMRRDPATGRIMGGGPNATARRLAGAQLRLAEREVRESGRSLTEELQNRRVISAAQQRYAIAAGNAAEAMEGLQGSIERQQAQVNQVTRAIGQGSRGNYLTNLFQGRQQAFARGGGGRNLPEALQRQAQDARGAWDIATAGGRENLQLMSRLATEMTGLVRQQNEFNRGRSLRSGGYEAGRRGQERITDLSRMAGADPARIRQLRSRATETIAASFNSDQPSTQLATRRMNAAIARYERELNAAARDLRLAQSRGGPRSPIRGTETMVGSPAYLAARPGLFQGNARKALGEGLIGGAFPLLFGQGVGASAGGLAGGFAGGMIGGSFGFGLSLVGTAIGQAVDTTVKNLTTLADAIRSPSKALDALEASGLASGRSLEKTRLYVDQLTAVGRAYDAQALVLREAEKRLGADGVRNLNALNSEQKRFQDQSAAIAGTIQSALLPALVGFTAGINDVIAAASGIANLPGAKEVAAARNALTQNPAGRALASSLSPFGSIGQLFGVAQGRGRAIAATGAGNRQPLSPQEAFANQTAAVQESRKLADQIQSAYRESFNLQRQAHDLQYDGAKLNREVANYVYGKEKQIFDLRQQAAERQIENTRAASQNRIERGDLNARQTFAAAVGFEQQLLSNVREVVRSRKEGEADIEQSRNRLELAMARLNRGVEDYKRTNAREIEDIERRKLSYVRSVEDYRMRVADYVLQRSRESADLMRQAMVLPPAGAAPGAPAGGSTPGGGAAIPGGASTAGNVDRLLQAANGSLGLFAGQTERCADAVRELFKVAGIAIGSTKKAWDGLTSGPRLASSFFGSDVGQRINRKQDLRPGDLVGFERTYGNWGQGVQTHVGLYAGNGQMYDHSSRRGLVKRPMDTFAGKFMYGVRPNAIAPSNAQGSASAQISNTPAPTFKPTPIGPTPSAAPLNAANLAAAAQLKGGQGEAQRILEDQIKLRQKGIELGQIEQILQANQLPQLQQQGEALKQQIDARQKILGLSDDAASVVDIEAEASARIKQIELDRSNALAKVKAQYSGNVDLAKQINTQADTALKIAKGEEVQRRANLELANQLQVADRARSEILQLQEDLSRGRAEAAALERGELQASAVELLKASALYQQMGNAQREIVAGLVAERELQKQANDFRRSIEEMRRDKSLTGAGLRAGFIGTGARAFEQGMKDFNGDTGRATQLAREAQLLESQQLIWQSLERNIVDTSSAISGGLTNGLLDIVSGSKKIEDVGREMLSNIARSFADSAQQQLNALLQRQLGGMLGGAGGPLTRMIGAGAEAAGPQALGAASMAASGQLAMFGAALQAVTAQMALSGAMGGTGSAFSGAASTLLGNAVPGLIPGFSPTYTFGGFFANGGTTRPGEAYVVGDGGEPEFFFPGTTGRVVPQSKMTKADKLRRQSRQSDTIDISYTVTEQAGQRFVTEDQFRRGMDATKRGARAATLAGLRNDKSQRDYVNI